jgi:hypothetical protein
MYYRMIIRSVVNENVQSWLKLRNYRGMRGQTYEKLQRFGKKGRFLRQYLK